MDRITVGLTGRADVYNPVVAETDEEMHKCVWEASIQVRATHMHVNLYVTDWVAAHWEDSVPKTMINWILNQKVQDLKHLLGDSTNTEMGMAILLE